jgi:hypothetical protein
MVLAVDLLAQVVLVMEILATIGYGYVVFKVLSIFHLYEEYILIGTVLVVGVSWIIILLDAIFRVFGGSMQEFALIVLLMGICGWFLIFKDNM